jgi:hypothetical protein
MDYSFVTDRLAVGGAINSADDVNALRAVAVNCIIDCRAEFDDAPLVAPLGLKYLWAGVPDWNVLGGQARQPLPAVWFKKIWDWALPLLSERGNVLYVHCHDGIYRGPTATYAILRAFGIKPEWARQMIHLARPRTIVGINGAQDCEAALKG